MGWACAHCGDVNALVVEQCEECGFDRGKGMAIRFEAQPVGTGLLWLATLLGGALAGYGIAVWNGIILKRHSRLKTATYAVVGVGGWLVTLWCLANLQPAHQALGGRFWEPGFSVPIALAISFLLVAIPYNLDTLGVNQWIWNHPGRKLVLAIGPAGAGLRYTSFSGATGELFGAAPERRVWISIPLLPVVVTAIALGIGIATVILGNALAPK